jgi:hypothetical protein
MSTARDYATATLLSEGKVLIASGSQGWPEIWIGPGGTRIPVR